MTATGELDVGALSTYDDFLFEMERLGLLDNLEDQLPTGFSAVFEIGRVLSDPDSSIRSRLAAAMELAPAQDIAPPDTTTKSDAQIVEVPAGEEYEAEFIRSWSDVRYVYSWQHLLPEEVFLRRLADRTLVFPMAKAPRIRAIDSGGDDFSPTPAKQKVHVLLDTSKSMALSHRFALAKSAVIHFLRENRREMGQVFLRTFDVDVGPLHSARTRTEFDALIRRIARIHVLGNGTCLERAILAACEDVREHGTLAGAEILVVTDGAARIHESILREALGADIRLHCVKIGHARVFPTDQYVKDVLDFRGDPETRLGQRVIQLRQRRRRLEDAARGEPGGEVRRGIEAELDRVAGEQRKVGDKLREEYGHEIERIANLYIEIDDLDPAEAFHLSDRQLEALKELTRQLLLQLEASPAPPDAMKRAALLMAHLTMLSREQPDAVAREFIEGLRSALEKHMESALASHDAHVLKGGLLSTGDQRDLRILLHGGSQRGSSLWLMLLKYFYNTLAKVIRPRQKR